MTTTSRTALIVADVQTGIVRDFPFARPVLPVLTAALPVARAHGVHVVFLRAGLRSNGNDVHPDNTLFRQFHSMGTTFHDDCDDTQPEPALRPQPEDSVVLKRRTSGFAHTDLDVVLRSLGIRNLVVTGVATSAVVAATVYAASDLDYSMTVLSDACADADPNLHDFLVSTLFPARGVVVSSTDDWLSSLQ
jgi:nicotinamidase-related amidase